MMAEGFLGRWSKRKAGIEPDSVEKKVEAPKELSSTPAVEKIEDEAPPLPTLDDVAKIDRFDPDFSAFMKPDVDPAVQQAALKKMFTDPHFNIMDGLDIYIDDYSKPDPLPPGMLERMVQSDMLKLFSKPAEDAANELAPDSQQTEVQAAHPESGAKALDVQKQSDLTSTQPKLSAQLDEVPKDVSTEPEQKKT
ncbi:DUF3306 domain-containing protein [Polynucleobacter sp. AP-Capit-er-40B-B4]|uniref:DUF3306 domain-containing protein n=1 Tax=Polynucleobacter sp. AP-Capit-er-40B-B4 TaxID=2576927 RepID=UPI001C0CC9E8|nr:DUF3306 domain-containing protein [Polynucleobacter sp. AP-Capit-er-40B-B4]MBU3580711.1 DUF3306 domain-containing protein [Polynucleobacter sp. AP-Capit-er-40B-B4]